MKTFKLKIHLGVWFTLAVILPSLLLGFLAIRTVAREEAFLEKRLEDSLQAEINHTVVLLKTELSQIQNELSRTLTALPTKDDFRSRAAQWRTSTSLVDVPFFLSADREILWPLNNGTETAKEKFFLKWSTDFFQDRETTPIYENIARVYKDKILEESQVFQQTTVPAPSAQKRMPVSQRTKVFSSSSWGQRELADNVGEQYSPAYFQQYAPVRKEVYRTAQAEGQQVAKRQVILQKSMKGLTNAPKDREESIFVADELKFSQVLKKSSSGIIPFIVKEKLRLLFWQEQPDRTIAGCLLDTDALIARIIRLLPGIYSEARILTVLDENGQPIIAPNENDRRDWREPFVAAEISEILPRWEVAAYLTHPNAIANKAQTTEVLIWIMIALLLVSIITGGTLVLRSLASEIHLAQQKTTFAANVSHELKTPLTSIRMFTEMLKDNRQPDEKKRQQYFEIMLSEVERLTRLINNVLDFSRRGKTKNNYRLRHTNIGALCQTIFEGQRVRLEYRGFSVQYSGPSEPLFVNADEEAIKQVLINLLSNAEKYSEADKSIEVAVTAQEDRVLINVLDRGIGIASQDAQRIFEEFYRVDDSLTAKTQGTGLGLTIAQRIARDHNGEVRYFPREGGGSLFQIQLPRAKD